MKTKIFLVFILLMSTNAHADLGERLAESAEISPDEAKTQVKQVFQALEAELLENKKVQIRKYGTFYLQERAARQATNPGSGEKVDVPAKSYPRFRSSDSFKKRVNQKS